MKPFDVLIRAMEEAGYFFDHYESSEDDLRFYVDGTCMNTVHYESWQEVQDWLEGVVFDDPCISDRVEEILRS